MRTIWISLACLTCCCLLNAWAEDFPAIQNTEKAKTSPMSPEEVVQTAKLPAGFKLGVFAAEPDVQNPIAMTSDERGRLWVAENYSWAGNNAGGFDKVQRDRVIILEDTDSDGKHDKRTVFYDQAHNLTSVEVGYGGVWLIALPQLLFIPDKNRDDIPDGPPQVMLDGFAEGPVGHTPANGLKWGPDGWLYARHGIQATSSIGVPGASDSQRVKINTGVWRYHPTRHTVEAIMHGMTNSWGFDYNEHNEMFVINTVIGHLWHVVPGAHVRRMYGVDLNPHTYHLIEQTADHVHWDTGETWGDVKKGMTSKTDAAGGGHAHIGLMIYQGDNWPEEYRNRIYTLNLHGMRINSEILERQGAGYVAKHGPDLVKFADPFFRGMELITGSDGGVFIADWSDTGECHDHDGVHRISGRIYKLTYGEPKKLAPFDLTTMKEHELVHLQLHENAWWARQAQRVLTERAVTGKEPKTLEARADLLRMLEEQINPSRRIKAMSTLFTIHGTNEDWLIDKMSAPEEHERVTALRFLVDKLTPEIKPIPQITEALLHSAKTDNSGLVQLYLAAALQRLPYEQRWPIAEQLIQRKEIAYDRMFPHMLWYGIEPAVPRDPAKAIALLRVSQVPLVTQNISRRLTLEIERDPATVEKLISNANATEDPNFASQIVIGIAEGLKGWRKAPVPKDWSRMTKGIETLLNDQGKVALRDLNIVFGDGRAIEELLKVAKNGQADAEERRQALRAILSGEAKDLVPLLHQLINDRAVNIEAVRGLAQFDDANTPKKILEKLGSFPPTTRAEAVNTLASRPSFANALLEAVKEKKLDKNEISAFHARQISSFEDADLTKLLTEVWGDVRVSAQEKRTIIDQHKVTLTAEWLAKANLGAGRALFQKNCSNCHVLYGIGKKVGPDLTGSNRKNLDYLLENIVDPSASVGADFRAMQIVLHNGRVISGVIIEQNERTLVVQTAQEPLTIDRKEIEEMKPTANSLMPDALLQNLNGEQVRDLLGYLMSPDQVPLPAN